MNRQLISIIISIVIAIIIIIIIILSTEFSHSNACRSSNNPYLHGNNQNV